MRLANKSMIRTFFLILLLNCSASEVDYRDDHTPGSQITDKDSVIADKGSLNLKFSGEDTDISVTKDFEIQLSGENGTIISWQSNNTAVVVSGSNAIVTRPQYYYGNATVTLTASIEKNGYIETKGFTIIVVENLTLAGDSITYNAGVSFNMRYVPAKTFPTGVDDSGEATICQGYLIAETEISYELWSTVYEWAVNGTGGATGEGQYEFANQGHQGGDANGCAGLPVGDTKNPVTCINWRDAIVFANALTEYYNAQNGTLLKPVYYVSSIYVTPRRNSTDTVCGGGLVGTTNGDCDNPFIQSSTYGKIDMSGCSAEGFRLLTSDEWEIAARYKGDDLSNGAIEHPISSAAFWTPGNYASGATAETTNFLATDLAAWFGNATVVGTGNTITTQSVAGKNENALGVFDMSGNVKEWVFDWDAIYTNARICRGGAYKDGDYSIQLGVKNFASPFVETADIGFRVAKWR